MLGAPEARHFARDSAADVADFQIYRGLIVVCFGRRDPWSHVPTPISCTNTLAGTRAPLPKSEFSTSRSIGLSGIAVAFNTPLEVFTRVGPYYSFERLTECGVGLVTDRPGDIYQLLIALL